MPQTRGRPLSTAGVTLRRRRGARAGTYTHRDAVLRKTLLLLLLVAIALTLGLLSMVFFLSTAAEPGTTTSVVHSPEQLTQSSHRHHPPPQERTRSKKEQPHVLLRGAEQQQHKPVSETATHQIDLERYDQDPVEEYPYLHLLAHEDGTSLEEIVAQYQPRGGFRFAEYTTGGTPWLVSEETQRKSDDACRQFRRGGIKSALQHAWDGYTTKAFGHDELQPVAGRGKDNWGGTGVTLIDSLDTLYLFNMTTAFQQAQEWVRDSWSLENVHQSVSVFETTIRDLGGLLAAYDWSGEELFLQKALDLGHRLMHAFDGSKTGIPFGQVNLATGTASHIGWTGGNAITAEAGTLQLEFRYLARLTHHPDMAQKTEGVFEALHQIARPNGLYPYYVRAPRGNNQKDGERVLPEFGNEKLTFGAMGDSLYEYMLKIWLQGGKTESMYRSMYDQSMQGMHDELLQTSTPSGLTYIADKNNGVLDHKMDHLVCFMGGLLALGAYTDPLGLDSDRAQRDLRTAKALTYTCYQMYARQATGIAPEFVQFTPDRADQDFQVGRGAPHYLLRPETVESFFVLHQLTGDPIYREWGWEVFLSIEKYCKTEFGYGALDDVNDTNRKPRDSMESFFLAETLKYLYLLHDPDTPVDILNKHVFNTEAHPMRIFPLIPDSEGLPEARRK